MFKNRCAFFRGLHHRPPRVRLGLAKGGDRHWDGPGGVGGAGVGGGGSGMIGAGGVGRGVLGAGGSTGGGIRGSGCASDGGGKGGGGGGGGMGYSDLGKDWQHSLVLATGSADGSIHLFDLSKGQVRRTKLEKIIRERTIAIHVHRSIL